MALPPPPFFFPFSYQAIAHRNASWGEGPSPLSPPFSSFFSLLSSENEWVSDPAVGLPFLFFFSFLSLVWRQDRSTTRISSGEVPSFLFSFFLEGRRGKPPFPFSSPLPSFKERRGR